MKISIVRKAVLPEIPHVSGVEVADGIIYLLSGDSSVLCKIKHDLTVLDSIALPGAANLTCMGQVAINGYKHLVLLPSGREPQPKEIGYLIKLPTNYNKKHLVWPIELTGLYRLLRSHEGVSGEEALSLQGLSFGSDKVYLFNVRSAAVLISYDKAEFVEYIQGHAEGTPFPSVLPVQEGLSTFSEADFFDNQLWFVQQKTSSAVFTNEAGILEILRESNGRYIEEKARVLMQTTVDDGGQPYPAKIMAVSVYEKDKEGVYTALAIGEIAEKKTELLLLDIHTGE
jgi:hypothetical protein